MSGLVPVQKEPEGKSGCWCSCAEKDFFRKEGNPVYINWEIIKPEYEEQIRIQQDNIRNLLKMQFFITDGDLLTLKHSFGPNFNYEKFTRRLLDLRNYITEHGATIKDKHLHFSLFHFIFYF